ncbi:MAG: phosphoglycerate mutase family protein [Chitinophagaceae bacterium]
MRVLILLLLVATSLTVKSQIYYIIRHAEKEQASSGVVMATPGNPPLSKKGIARAQALKDLLMDKHIHYIFSTNTIRTIATVKPLGDAIGVRIETYSKADSAFIEKLKTLDQNTLIVGHSNTVDDIVNTLSKTENVRGDLPDTKYDNLYVVKINGSKISFQALKYGKASE